ncbi:hypothetical protein FSP39_024501 [Pinctada imbricata]|uniref:DED domain-containing protein n=1 Tax=Pinctada imbricata TaxID=66713 RepID=A0AA89C2J3_PINIB|nr:hypothetical protein FSP39_024501 [Pinctada imbricata]
MLLQLSKSLNDEDLENMKFLCKDMIKKREREKITTPIELWEQLETREKLGPQNLTFLKTLLANSCDGKLDLRRIVENYELGGVQNGTTAAGGGIPPPLPPPPQYPVHGVQPFQLAGNLHVYQAHQPYMMPNQGYGHMNPQSSALIEPLKKEINFLTKNLGREWRFFMRTLDLTDADMSSIEQSCPRNLKDQIYQCMCQVIVDHKGQLRREDIVRALRDSSVERCDLAARIEDGDI